MKEMIYGDKEKIEVLYEGEYKGYKFAIVSRGTYPAAYVENKVNAIDYSDNILGDIIVHGGFTFCDKGYWSNIAEKINWLGWSYDYFNDYIDGCHWNYGTKWTTSDIYEQVKNVIEQFIEIRDRKRDIAKEILQRISKYNTSYNVDLQREINRIAEEYGVKLEDIHK